MLHHLVSAHNLTSLLHVKIILEFSVKNNLIRNGIMVQELRFHLQHLQPMSERWFKPVVFCSAYDSLLLHLGKQRRWPEHLGPYVGNLEGVPGSCHLPGPVPASSGHLKSRPADGSFFSLSLPGSSPTLSILSFYHSSNITSPYRKTCPPP